MIIINFSPKHVMMSICKNELLHFWGNSVCKFGEYDVFIIDISFCGKEFSVHFGMSCISSLWNFIWSQLPSAPNLIQWQRTSRASVLKLKQTHFIRPHSGGVLYVSAKVYREVYIFAATLWSPVKKTETCLYFWVEYCLYFWPLSELSKSLRAVMCF